MLRSFVFPCLPVVEIRGTLQTAFAYSWLNVVYPVFDSLQARRLDMDLAATHRVSGMAMNYYSREYLLCLGLLAL